MITMEMITKLRDICKAHHSCYDNCPFYVDNECILTEPPSNWSDENLYLVDKALKGEKELVEIVRCKNCIHRPVKGERDDNRDITYPPKDSRGWGDFTCPCLNEDDGWYSWYPSDDWFCAEGEMKGDKDENTT